VFLLISLIDYTNFLKWHSRIPDSPLSFCFDGLCTLLSHEDPRALDQLGRDRIEWYADSSSVSSSDGHRLRLTEATGAESEAAVPSKELAKGALDPPAAATVMRAPKVTAPVPGTVLLLLAGGTAALLLAPKVNTAVPIGAAVFLAPMLATPADATAAALLAFAGGKAAANIPGAPVAFPEAEAAAVVPLLAQPETPASQPVGPL
jgi:hypothetical protein